MNDVKIKINSLVERLKKIGVDIKLSSNYPWIYLDSVNGNRVKEKFYSEHCYTIGFIPLSKESKFKFLDIKNLFKIIRKYI